MKKQELEEIEKQNELTIEEAGNETINFINSITSCICENIPRLIKLVKYFNTIKRDFEDDE